MRAETAGDQGPWRQQAILGLGRWKADALRHFVRNYVVETKHRLICLLGRSNVVEASNPPSPNPRRTAAPPAGARFFDAAEPDEADYVLWDDDLPGFWLRVFKSGKRSYLVQYRSGGRSRRFTIGLHGVWTPETARKEAHVLLGKIAQGENPAEQKLLDIHAITVKELCERYMTDSENGLIMGKGRRPNEILHRNGR